MNDSFAHILAQAVGLPDAALTAPEWIMWMPAGEHVIQATRNDKPAKLKVKVDAAAADIVQADLERILASNTPPPFFGFDHVDGRACAWPERFEWREGSGIWAKVRWTPDGAESVTIREPGQLPAYRYFSPAFRASNNGRITGLWPTEAGSLVNNPAFRAIARITAQHADDPSAPAESNTTQPTMNHQAIAEACVKCGLLTSEEAAGTNAADLITNRVAACNTDKATRASQAAELTQVKARNTELQNELAGIKAARAKEHVDKAVQDGRIAAQDTATQQFWTDSIVDRGDSAVKALQTLPTKLPGKSATPTPGAKITAGQSEADGEESEAVRIRAKQVEAKALELQRETGKAWPVCWSLAEATIAPAA